MSFDDLNYMEMERNPIASGSAQFSPARAAVRLNTALSCACAVIILVQTIPMSARARIESVTASLGPPKAANTVA